MSLALPPDQSAESARKNARIDEAERKINAALARVCRQAPRQRDTPTRGLDLRRFMAAQQVFRDMAENPLDMEDSGEIDPGAEEPGNKGA